MIRKLTIGLTQTALQGVLSAFVAYIEETKTVVLEDLAADFNMRVQVWKNFCFTTSINFIAVKFMLLFIIVQSQQDGTSC